MPLFFSQPKRRNFYRKTQLKKYQSGMFTNPYFQSQTPKRLWFSIFIGLFFGFSIGLTSFFFTSPFFHLEFIRIQGVTQIPPAKIQASVQDYLSERSFFLFFHRNQFLFDEETIKTRLQKLFSFKSIEITKEQKTVVIQVEEREGKIVLESKNIPYLLGEEGIVVRHIEEGEYELFLHPPQKEGPMTSGGLIPQKRTVIRLVDLTQMTPAIGEVFLSQNSIAAILRFAEGLEESEIAIEKMEINKDIGFWITVQTKQGYDLLFDLEHDPSLQLQNLNTALKKTIEDPSHLEYIDLRFDDRVYFK